MMVYLRFWVSTETLEDELLSVHSTLARAEAACEEGDWVEPWPVYE